MTIERASENMSVKQKYDLMYGSQTLKMQDIEDAEIRPAAWALYEDDNKRVLSITDDAGTVYGTISATFIKAFEDILDFCESEGVELHTIKVIGGDSKGGRHYISCTYID